MAGKTVQRRRGTTAEHAAFTGANGEITVDITKKVVVVHDGATAGGFPMVRSGPLAGTGITGAAAAGANSDITSLSGLTTPLTVAQGGTNSATAAAARVALGVVGWDLVSTQTAAASATIDFTGLSGTDDDYMVRLENVIPATNDSVLYLRVSNAATFKTDALYSYDSTVTNIAAGAPSGAVASGVATFVQITGNVNSTTAEGGASGVVDLFNLSSTASYKHNLFKLHYNNSVNGGNTINGGFAYRGSTAAIDGLRFLFNTGNIASGKFLLYKLRKA